MQKKQDQRFLSSQIVESNSINARIKPVPKGGARLYAACEDLKPFRKLVVYPGIEAFPLRNEVQAVSLEKLCAELALKKAKN